MPLQKKKLNYTVTDSDTTTAYFAFSVQIGMFNIFRYIKKQRLSNSIYM